MTQRELAQAAKVSPSTISQIEQGPNRGLRPSIMRKIAEALGVQPADIDEFRPILGVPLEQPPDEPKKRLAA
jgi:transcriptional regulator with XRE-family HTH domain